MSSTGLLRAEIKTLELAEPFRISHGTSRQRQVLRLYHGESVGEAPFVPYYPEDPQETLQWIEDLRWQGGQAPLSGPRAGRLALDILWHDIIGRARRQPLWTMWGFNATSLPAGCRSFSIPTDWADFSEKVKAIARQFRILKLKLGSGDLNYDEEIVVRARQSAPQAILLADVNGGWTVAEAAKIIPRLARFGVEFVEQPLHAQEEVAAWKSLRSTLPACPLNIYADESVQNAADVKRYAGALDGVNVKLLKCGSFIEAQNMIETARSLRMSVLLGCMIESSVGVSAAAHLAPLVDWIDLDGHLYVANDDYTGIAYDAEGWLRVPDRPGLGVSRRDEAHPS